MTKDDFRLMIVDYKLGNIGAQEMQTAVDTYTSAIIAQSKCSTLRELLVQMQNSLTADSENLDKLKAYRNKCRQDIEFVTKVIQLIDVFQPVA